MKADDESLITMMSIKLTILIRTLNYIKPPKLASVHLE